MLERRVFAFKDRFFTEFKYIYYVFYSVTSFQRLPKSSAPGRIIPFSIAWADEIFDLQSRWAYILAVVLKSEWPSHSWICFSGTPLWYFLSLYHRRALFLLSVFYGLVHSFNLCQRTLILIEIVKGGAVQSWNGIFSLNIVAKWSYLFQHSKRNAPVQFPQSSLIAVILK